MISEIIKFCHVGSFDWLPGRRTGTENSGYTKFSLRQLGCVLGGTESNSLREVLALRIVSLVLIGTQYALAARKEGDRFLWRLSRVL